MARRTDHSGRNNGLPCLQCKKQFGLPGHRRGPGSCKSYGQPARTPSSAQCPHQADVRIELRERVQICPRLRRSLRKTGLSSPRSRERKALDWPVKCVGKQTYPIYEKLMGRQVLVLFCYLFHGFYLSIVTIKRILKNNFHKFRWLISKKAVLSRL